VNRVNFSDWQEMALKKDIEQIKKKLTSQEPVLFSLCWELVLALGSIIADHLFDTENAPEWIWFTVIALAVIPAAVILGVVVGKWICSIVSVKKGKFNVKDSVDIFDNQISYWVMLSNAYTDMLLEDINGTNSEKEFLYREGCYYNNKSMQAIYAMKSNFDKIFSMDPQKVKEDSLVDMERLFNILRVMKEQQDRLDATISEISSEGIKRQRELNEKYMDDLMKFVKDLNESNEKSRIKTFKWDEN
jgi:hypothetical protein